MNTKTRYQDTKSKIASRKRVLAVQRVLNKMEVSEHVGSFHDGEEYICATCNLPLKLCAGNPDALCILKATGNTELSLLANRLEDEVATAYGRCKLCGRQLSHRRRLDNPLREICSSCEERKVRKNIH